jgi:hypothetical protein
MGFILEDWLPLEVPAMKAHTTRIYPLRSELRQVARTGWKKLLGKIVTSVAAQEEVSAEPS